LIAGEAVSIASGDLAWPGIKMVWIPVSGGLRLFGDINDTVPAGVVLPVPAQVWLWATESIELTPLDGHDVFGAPEARAGSDALTGMVMARLLRQIAREQQADTQA